MAARHKPNGLVAQISPPRPAAHAPIRVSRAVRRQMAFAGSQFSIMLAQHEADRICILAMVKVTLNLPHDLEERLRQQTADLDADVTEAYVLELFRRGAIDHFELSRVL